MGKFCCCSKCCIKAEELPVSVTVGGVSIVGDWEKLSDCCWRLTSTSRVSIPGFNVYDHCEKVHERTTKYECFYQSYYYDFLDIPIYDGVSIPVNNAKVLRKVRTDHTIKQEGVIRVRNESSKISVYLSRVSSICSGVKACRWSVGISAFDNNGSLRIVKQIVSMESHTTELYRSPVLSLTDYTGVPCPDDDFILGSSSSEASEDTCDLTMGIGNPVWPQRAKVLNDRPASVTLARGDGVDCGHMGCMPPNDDDWTFSLNCDDISPGRLCGFLTSEPPPPYTSLARSLHPANGKHLYHLSVGGLARYIRTGYNSIPIGWPLPDFPETDCSIDGVPRYITKLNRSYPQTELGFLNVDPHEWTGETTILHETCNGFAEYTLVLPSVDVAFSWPG